MCIRYSSLFLVVFFFFSSSYSLHPAIETDFMWLHFSVFGTFSSLLCFAFLFVSFVLFCLCVVLSSQKNHSFHSILCTLSSLLNIYTFTESNSNGNRNGISLCNAILHHTHTRSSNSINGGGVDGDDGVGSIRIRSMNTQ